jgi:ABC-type branched-subunit amino acid transport system substrate-binding protein
MKRRAFISAAGAAAAAAASIAPVRAQIPLQQQFLQQLNVGVNVTLSGPYGRYGAEVVKGVQSAVDEINKFNAPISHVYGLRSFDDRNQAIVASTNVSVAASDPSVIGIVGNLTAEMTLASLPHYANNGFAVFVPTVTADQVTRRGYHNVYRLPASDSDSGRLFAAAALYGKRAVASLAVALDGSYGFDVARAFVQQAKSDHHPADILLFPKDTAVDPAAAARTILDREPGYVFLAGKTAELGPIVEALRLANYTGDFGASDGFYNGDTIAKYGKFLMGAQVASSLPPLERVPSIMSLLSDFEHEVGQVTAFSAYGYAAAQLMIAASQRGNASNRFSLLTAMQRGGTWTTLVGNFNFNVNGEPLLPNIYLYNIGKDGFDFAQPAIRSGFVV